MDTKELLKKVRKIEIKTRGLSNHVFSGEYHSVFKGRGMSFNEVREYQFGDEIRAIDWNVTARLNQPYIKVFEEDRELTVMLLVDVSESAFFGTRTALKSDMIAEICAVLSFSAIQNSDKVGLLLFSNKVEKYIPPKKGKKHILRLIREMIQHDSEEKGTNVSMALEFFVSIMKKRSIAFLVSDFIDSDYSDALRLAGKKHDLVGLKVFDPLEEELPNLGLIRVADAETGDLSWVDSSSKRVQKQYADYYKEHDEYFKDSFMRSGSDSISVRTDQDYVTALLKFFKKRGGRK